MRVNELTSEGMVLPIAWNMLEATKMIPDATKLHDTMRRYSSPTAMTAASFGEDTNHRRCGRLRREKHEDHAAAAMPAAT